MVFPSKESSVADGFDGLFIIINALISKYSFAAMYLFYKYYSCERMVMNIIQCFCMRLKYLNVCIVSILANVALFVLIHTCEI